MDDIYPPFEPARQRRDNEALLRQRARVVWLYGLSGAGKSTLAAGLAAGLLADGRVVQILDGDNVRTGLNRGLAFSDADRTENIRRIAEVAKLFVEAGVVCINSFITPTNRLRSMAREIIGPDDFIEVYLACTYETCRDRDVKGLYAKAEAGLVKDFTGRDSSFEPPDRPPDLVIDTDALDVASSVDCLVRHVRDRIALSPSAET